RQAAAQTANDHGGTRADRNLLETGVLVDANAGDRPQVLVEVVSAFGVGAELLIVEVDGPVDVDPRGRVVGLGVVREGAGLRHHVRAGVGAAQDAGLRD